MHQNQLSECIDLELRARQISLGTVEYEWMCRFLNALPLVPARQLVEINAKLLAVGATLDLATDNRPK